jgi:hypothetical protein
MPPGGPCGAPVRAQASFTNTCKDASRRALRGSCGAWRPSGSFTIEQIYRLIRLNNICSNPMFGLLIRDTQEDFGWGMSTDMIATTPQSGCNDVSRRALRGSCGGLASQREFYHRTDLSTNTTKQYLLKTNVWTADTRHTRRFWMGHFDRHDHDNPAKWLQRCLPAGSAGALRDLASQREFYHRTDYRLIRLNNICSNPMFGLPI